MRTGSRTKSPCPNPTRGGCGCPQVEHRCRGWVRIVREAFEANLAQPGPDQGDRVLAAYRTVEEHPSWTAAEILRRF
jgi:hypothetical protein